MDQEIMELDMREDQIRNGEEDVILERGGIVRHTHCYKNESEEELIKCKTAKKFTFNGEIHLAKVVRCYDGDTCYCIFKHNNKYQLFSIRMYGYDSWEMKVGKDVPEEEKEILKQKGLDAKHKLEELVLGKCIYLFCREFDKYGRLLADIKINLDDKITVNQIMINEGYGYNYYGGTKKPNRL